MKPIPAERFRRLAPEEIEAPVSPETRPAPSVRSALRQSARARWAAGAVVLLLLFAFVGPLLWPQDPAQQWLSRVSVGPSPARAVTLLPPERQWQPGQTVSEPVVVAAYSEWVRLQWPEPEGAQRYQVYRSAGEGAGVLLDTVFQPWFEDRLQLRLRDYHYRIVALDGGGQVLEETWLSASPAPAIGWMEAQLQGLLPEDAKPAQWLGERLELPAHPLGTDALGRDMLARLMHGARTSLFVGIVAPLLFIGFGTLYGAFSALGSRGLDNWLMRGADFVVALPFLLFMILFRVAFGVGPGESGILPMMVAMVLLIWPSSARLVRGQVLQLRSQAYVQAARLAGAGQFYLIRRHLLPNVTPIILVSLSFAIPQAIFLEAFLSFIGMGVAPPAASLGSLCHDGMRNMLAHPHELLFPALLISAVVLAFNMLGEALRDTLDVRMRRGPL